MTEEQNILGLTVGKVYELGDVWDGNGEVPTESYSYWLDEDLWVDYQFKFINAEDKENLYNGGDILSIPVKLTNIDII